MKTVGGFFLLLRFDVVGSACLERWFVDRGLDGISVVEDNLACRGDMQTKRGLSLQNAQDEASCVGSLRLCQCQFKH